MLEVQTRGDTGGEPLKIYGKEVIEIWIGPLYFDHTCVLGM